MRRRLGLVVAAVPAVALIVLPAAAQVTLDVFTVPTPESTPTAITRGPEGNLWFVEAGAEKVGRITPGGAVTERSLGAGSAPQQIVAGVDGRVYVTLSGRNVIAALEARVGGIGPKTEIPVPTEEGAVAAAALGPAGVVWYAAAQFNTVGWVAPGEDPVEHHLETDAVRGILALGRGPDDAMWFTQIAEPAGVGRVDALGGFREHLLPTPDSVPGSLATGADGNLWITHTEAPILTRLTPAGVATELTLGFPDMATLAIVPGPDGNLWISQLLTGNDEAAIVRLDPVGLTFGRFVLPAPHVTLGLAFDRAGNLWFTDPVNHRIARLNLGLPIRPTPPADVTATALSSSSIALSWRDTSPVETRFTVYRRNAAGNLVTVATRPANATGATIQGLAPATTHTFWVRAGNAVGDSALSLDASARTPADGAGCTPTSTTMCLNAGRFRVSVDWRDFGGQSGTARVVPVGSDDSGLFWFFGPDNWEMLVKVLDGCGVNGRFWVFSAATTNVEYTLRVADSLSGAGAEYFNPLGNSAAALTDTDALDACGSRVARGEIGPPPVRRVELGGVEPGSALGERIAAVTPRGSCTPGPTRMCLGGGRFRVEVDWRDFAGQAGSAHVVPVGSDDSGLFWFFGANNWEMLVKVLDGCGVNGHRWVFSAATTNVEYTLRVTDTDNGTTATYFNPLGTSAAAITDTEALATCP